MDDASPSSVLLCVRVGNSMGLFSLLIPRKLLLQLIPIAQKIDKSSIAKISRCRWVQVGGRHHHSIIE